MNPEEGEDMSQHRNAFFETSFFNISSRPILYFNLVVAVKSTDNFLICLGFSINSCSSLLKGDFDRLRVGVLIEFFRLERIEDFLLNVLEELYPSDTFELFLDLG